MRWLSPPPSASSCYSRPGKGRRPPGDSRQRFRPRCSWWGARALCGLSYLSPLRYSYAARHIMIYTFDVLDYCAEFHKFVCFYQFHFRYTTRDTHHTGHAERAPENGPFSALYILYIVLTTRAPRHHPVRSSSPMLPPWYYRTSQHTALLMLTPLLPERSLFRCTSHPSTKMHQHLQSRAAPGRAGRDTRPRPARARSRVAWLATPELGARLPWTIGLPLILLP